MKITEFLEANGAKVWTKGSIALDADGQVIMPEDPKAVCFCAVGLLDLFYPNGAACPVFQAIIGTVLISTWNDRTERTFEDVLSAFRKAGL